MTIEDTLTGFYKKCSQNKFFYYLKKSIYFIFQVFYKLGWINNDQLKKIGIVIFLKGKHRSHIDKYSKEYSNDLKLNTIYEKYFEHSYVSEREMVIISASFSDYLYPIFNRDKITVFGSELLYSRYDRVCGLEKNLFGESKKEFVLNFLKIDKVDKLYTDSLTDLPLAQIAKEIVVVKNSREYPMKDLEDFLRFFN